MTEHPSHQRLLAVAALLSQDAAAMLVDLEPSTQMFLLRALTASIDYWEAAEVKLDPVQFDVVVTSFVASYVPTVKMMDAALTLLARRSTCEHSTS